MRDEAKATQNAPLAALARDMLKRLCDVVDGTLAEVDKILERHAEEGL